jgi:pseudaminic acid biosynthesis-associated methylase
MTKTAQLDAWRGDFGNEYVDRNAPLADVLRMRTRMWAAMLKSTFNNPPSSFLEVGCNIGLNLRAIDRLIGAEPFAVEPNDKARATLLSENILPADNLFNATGQDIPVADGAVEMSFSAGVLIHVHPDDLPKVADEMHRVTSRWLLVAEYFSAKPETIPYRGRDDLLFKRDFGGFFMDRFDDLEIVDDGFLWSRTSGIDDVTWALFRKKGA